MALPTSKETQKGGPKRHGERDLKTCLYKTKMRTSACINITACSAKRLTINSEHPKDAFGLSVRNQRSKTTLVFFEANGPREDSLSPSKLEGCF